MIPVTVLTGFLGSGKTTLLARLLRTPAFARTAVIINEFGEIGIDHDLVAASEESFVELETGCICCQVRGDVEATLADLVGRRQAGTVAPFERIVIETSGLADPAPVLNAIMAETGRGAPILLDAVVTTIDAVNGLATLDREPQSVRQAAVADRLILTKTDLVGGALDEPLLARIRQLNPRAPLHIAVSGEIDPWLLLGDCDATEPSLVGSQISASGSSSPLRPTGRGRGDPGTTSPSIAPPPPALTREGEGDAPQTRDPQPVTASLAGMRHARAQSPASADPIPHDPGIVCITIRRDEPMPALALTLLLEALADHVGADLLRLKGLVHIAERPGQPAVIHGVQHVFHEPRWLERWPSDDRSTRLVLIGRRLSQLWVETLMAAVSAEIAEVGIQMPRETNPR